MSLLLSLYLMYSYPYDIHAKVSALRRVLPVGVLDALAKR
jgi:hypothetical protein